VFRRGKLIIIGVSGLAPPLRLTRDIGEVVLRAHAAPGQQRRHLSPGPIDACLGRVATGRGLAKPRVIAPKGGRGATRMCRIRTTYLAFTRHCFTSRLYIAQSDFLQTPSLLCNILHNITSYCIPRPILRCFEVFVGVSLLFFGVGF